MAIKQEIMVDGNFTDDSAKTTPVDADLTIINDSEDTNKQKKLSWSSIKATLKTYFDGLYTLVNLGGVPTSRQVNGHALSADVTVTKSDVNLGNVTNDAQLKATQFSGLTKITVSSSAPSSPNTGDLWVDTGA